MKVQLKKVKTAGFSLVELLVVIAVIGIMAAIAIPMISNINSNATAAKNKRNAQNIASVYGAACAAGSTDVLAATDVAGIVTALQGGKPGAGQFGTTTFRVSVAGPVATATSEAGQAAAELTFDNATKVLTVN
jgi:prepilin-type N-terminal cleavage/methylation domain-containing protein